jgi:hypothetical protein
MRTILAVTLAASMLAAAPGYAHHSFAAEFDADKPVTLVGTVTKIEWTNPHAWFYIDVRDDAGKVANWGWELGSPTSLVRLGWSRTALKVGEVITVEGSRSRDGSNTANTRSITLNRTGQKLFGASSQAPK